MLKQLFAQAVPSKGIANVAAIIVPHAGYPFSGVVAASGFNQIDPNKEYDNIFVLGPSHYVGFDGAAVYTRGNFITPLGVVKVNTELAKELIRADKIFSDRNDAQEQEHSIEVELPFLQYRLKKDFRIVPIVVGSSSIKAYQRIAEKLQPYFNSRNLFVISTDFSHYPPYEDAEAVDKATAAAVLTNSPEALIKTVQANAKRNIPNLATSMCGLADVLTLLYMTQNHPDVTYTAIQYKNSGDADPSVRRQVVGYYAIAVSLKSKEQSAEFELTPQDKRDLLTLSRTTIEQYLRSGKIPDVDPARFSATLRTPAGAFVTLNEHEQLRGCIGRFQPNEPLYRVTQEMAVAAATQDTRFPPVQLKELSQLEIEVSVLTPLRRIQSIDEIQMGKQGVYLRKGRQSGVFLPQVATQTGWTKEEFLGHCAQDKARIGWNGWRSAEIYTFEAIVFSEKDSLR